MPTVLITGANRGIGLALARQFKERGDAVIAVCRRSSSELDALGVEVIDGIDGTSDQAVSSLGKRVADRRIDLLLLNAGILGHDGGTGIAPSLDLNSVREQFEVNALGPLRVARELIPGLAKGAKIALMTSRMGSIGDNGSGGSYGYRMSKAALNAMGMSLARDLKSRGIAVALLHPGYVRTDMTGGAGAVDPADAARMLVQRIDGLTLENSGTFWHANGERLPW
jgi:NAD(P)-dependent dehydrogenase (short-subunit alcohol dehydrogenase family)